MIALLTVVWTVVIAIAIGLLVYASSRWILRRGGRSDPVITILKTYSVVYRIGVILGGIFFVVLFGLALIALVTRR